MRKFHKAADRLKKGYQSIVKECKDKNGKLIGEEQKFLEGWWNILENF
jgi:hypothetical protein